MSTYNGERYLEEQIHSIFNQIGVQVELMVRDDGSTDGTLNILKNIQQMYPNRMQIIEGKNIGYKKSFLKMLELIDPNADFFAFSDQDDVWKKEKLEKAIQTLQEEQSDLYACSLYIVDKDLQTNKKKDISSIKNTLGSFLARSRVPGCAMVFSKEIVNLAQQYSNLSYPDNCMLSHDNLICILAALYDKKIVFDNEAYLLHRRHDNACTSGGNGVSKRIHIEWNVLWKDRSVYTFVSELATTLADIPNSNQENILLLNQIKQYKSSFVNKIKLIGNQNLSCGNIICDVLVRIRILIGRY